MVEGGKHLPFDAKARNRIGTLEPARDEFYGDRPNRLVIPNGFVDRAHAAAANFPQDFPRANAPPDKTAGLGGRRAVLIPAGRVQDGTVEAPGSLLIGA